MTTAVDKVDKISIHPNALVCQDADLRGSITISSGTVIHPKCTILAVPGAIVIGENCIIEESAIIVNRRKEPMLIGDENVFEVGSRVEAASVGSRNTFSVKSRVISSIEIPNDCSIGPACILTPSYTSPQREDFRERLQDYTVVYGQNPDRRIGDAVGKIHQRALLAKHLEYLRNALPKYIKMRNV
ncbi:hypothetical protein E3P92_00760 [Wallemia ichthyophaga]|uniref:Dynactin subunit 6 n=2 Tax=Wallemia ichthyophaga TaxID=245174 RepID=A0A4T0IPT8_WALIC|nr:Dynactin subunit 6 [Wallemia ichthyophaga EXF-994]TIA75624.1 hypothetical protein E3P91_00369 [Wallemia ichthyophaga]EOR01688.1 Dynactin subunit 6 [Wallemia ichthyophaga EXF-994]TIA93906.1 hypothetical protein E3P97_00666 [Wallemia ichthyophaga]TIB14035.1 hypothetical protein E3P90_01417 [Wallemia ichthyophaga]TIB15918.1 hypothetical protein E3P93_01168 [Wallemia ichthyophaga]